MKTFDSWMADINDRLIRRIGFDTDDLPDQLYRDWYDDGVTAAEAVDLVLENEGIDL